VWYKFYSFNIKEKFSSMCGLQSVQQGVKTKINGLNKKVFCIFAIPDDKQFHEE
jgi:hypothetical protein